MVERTNPDHKEIGDDQKSVWEELSSRYKVVNHIASPGFEHLIDRPTAQTVVLSARPHGQSITFRDLEFVTYYFNFSTENLEKVLAQDESYKIDTEGILIREDRGTISTSIAERLRELIKDGKKITHIICAEQLYGGETHYSVWREYEKAEVYEFDEDRFKWLYRFVEPSFANKLKSKILPQTD